MLQLGDESEGSGKNCISSLKGVVGGEREAAAPYREDILIYRSLLAFVRYSLLCLFYTPFFKIET